MQILWNVFGLYFSFTAYANKPIELATYPIPLMVETKDRGLFVDVTREIAKRTNKKINISVYPAGKTHVTFTSNKVHGFFPALDISVPKKAVRTVPFYHKVDYIFHKKSKPTKGLKDLEGKKVGLTFRYLYAKEVAENKKIKFEYASDDILNIKKLGKGLIDAFVVERKLGLNAVQTSGEEGITFNKENPVSEQSVFYAFQNSPEGKELAASFSRAIESMQQDGSLGRIFADVP